MPFEDVNAVWVSEGGMEHSRLEQKNAQEASALLLVVTADPRATAAVSRRVASYVGKGRNRVIAITELEDGSARIREIYAVPGDPIAARLVAEYPGAGAAYVKGIPAQAAAVTPAPDRSPVARSTGMWLVGYFLARCGVRESDGPSRPPKQLQISTWNETFDIFYAYLGGGRKPEEFRHSLKNCRDLFDAHLGTGGRVGWRSVRTGAADRPPQPLPAAAKEVLETWAGRSDKDLWAEVRKLIREPSEPRESLEQLAMRLHLRVEYVRDIDWLLRDKHQVVFYGPPGTGKTYVAEQFARWFAEGADRVETIQFHSSYAYEDFVEGIRPTLDSDQVAYRLEPGILRNFAAAATADPDDAARYVLIIDEVNRANLSRVFGELLYLLEYRLQKITLPYSKTRFGLPDNLYLIGTMNTADRSIALVDFALRRRFHFVQFPSDVNILRRWLATNRPSMLQVADLLAWVNRQIDDPDFAIGFSYFMREDLDDEILERVWAHSVLPTLSEFFFDDTHRRESFTLDRVRRAVAAEQSADSGAGSTEGSNGASAEPGAPP